MKYYVYAIISNITGIEYGVKKILGNCREACDIDIYRGEKRNKWTFKFLNEEEI